MAYFHHQTETATGAMLASTWMKIMTNRSSSLEAAAAPALLTPNAGHATDAAGSLPCSVPFHLL